MSPGIWGQHHSNMLFVSSKRKRRRKKRKEKERKKCKNTKIPKRSVRVHGIRGAVLNDSIHTQRHSGQSGMFMPEKVLHCLVTREQRARKELGTRCDLQSQVLGDLLTTKPYLLKILEPPRSSTNS